MCDKCLCRSQLISVLVEMSKGARQVSPDGINGFARRNSTSEVGKLTSIVREKRPCVRRLGRTK